MLEKNIGLTRKLFTDLTNKGFSQDDLTVVKEAWPQIEWSVIPPDAPHRVGGAEAMVKILKRSLRYIPTSTLSIMEFHSVLSQIASSINNRPLGYLASEDSILTPNQLILGRNYNTVHPTIPGPELNIAFMLPHVKNIVSNWFERWHTAVVPNMFKVSRWEKDCPDLQVGDLCLLDQKKGRHGLQGYKYCRVEELIESRDGRTRTVKIKYFNSPSTKPKYVVSDVRKLTLIPKISDPIKD